MKLREAIAIINKMRSEGIISGYAIGGAVGATFYLEPVATIDLDVFVSFKAEEAIRLVTLNPIFDFLQGLGCTLKGEYVIIADWPVQFLPPTGPIIEEAIVSAVAVDLDGVEAKVFTAEHLAAVALQTGRPKYKARLLQFFESGVLDERLFDEIVKRHGLSGQLEYFRSTMMEGYEK